VIADGIPADVIERLDPPSLKSIGQAGGYARAYVGGEKMVIRKHQRSLPSATIACLREPG
jgi:hypothetical protein